MGDERNNGKIKRNERNNRKETTIGEQKETKNNGREKGNEKNNGRTRNED
jgi:hypothetical protein